MATGYRREDLRNLAQSKLDDARLLFEHGRYANAYYLAGYSVEIALKACISRQISENTLPDPKFIGEVYRGHDLKKLISLAGIVSEFEKKSASSAEFSASWSILAAWTPDARYRHCDEPLARNIIIASGDEEKGVLPWIRTYW